jgi:hypothetical protein
MKRFRWVFASFTLATAIVAAPPAQQSVVGRTIYHADKSRTESVRDPSIREMTESTYDPNGVLTVKKVFLTNEKGEPLQGNVYDGRGNLVARCQSFYDNFGRRTEDRLTNLNGEVFQRVIHEYDKAGKALTPKVINLNTQAAPTIKPAAIDFTGGGAPAAPQSSSRFAPIQADSDASGPIYAPGAEPAKQQEAAKPKGNFFKRLFPKKTKQP